MDTTLTTGGIDFSVGQSSAKPLTPPPTSETPTVTAAPPDKVEQNISPAKPADIVFNIDDFSASPRDNPPVADKPQPTETKEEVKPEVKKEPAAETKKEKPATEEVTTPFPPAKSFKKSPPQASSDTSEDTAATATLPENRDYSAYADVLSPDEIKDLRKMGNNAWKVVSSRLSELQKLRKNGGNASAVPEIPQSYYENPDGYILTPQYRQAKQQLNELQAAHDHWMKQLENIEMGKEWEDFDQDASGKLVMIKRPADEKAKVAVNSYLMNAKQMVFQGSQGLQAWVGEFQRHSRNLSSAVRNAEKSFFPDFEDEKHPAHESIKRVKNYLESNGLGTNILTPLVAKFYTRMKEYADTIKELQEQLDAKNNPSAPNPSRQPSSSDAGGISTANNNPADVVYDISAFSR